MDNANAARALFAPEPSITGLAQLFERQMFPSPGDVNSFFNSVGSRLSTAVVPGQIAAPAAGDPTGGGNTGGGGLSGLLPGNGGSILPGGGGSILTGLGNNNGGSNNGGTTGGGGNLLGGLFGNGTIGDAIRNGPLGSIFNNISGQAATGIISVANTAVKTAMAGFGIADQYSVYLRDVCAANITDGTQNMGPQLCSPLRRCFQRYHNLSWLTQSRRSCTSTRRTAAKLHHPDRQCPHRLLSTQHTRQTQRWCRPSSSILRRPLRIPNHRYHHNHPSIRDLTTSDLLRLPVSHLACFRRSSINTISHIPDTHNSHRNTNRYNPSQRGKSNR